MAEKYSSDYDNRNYFKEAVCIDAMRIYDSCSDKDCLEDIRVYITPEQQQFVETAKDVRIKGVSVVDICIETQELPFNKGYYSCEISFFIDITVELLCTSVAPVLPLSGVAVFKKKCVMYGGEGSVKTFRSDENEEDRLDSAIGPVMSVQVAEPVALSAKVCEERHMHGCGCDCGEMPKCVCKRYGELDCRPHGKKAIFATIGLFTIMQMARNVQMMIPAYDFCVPTKECTCGETQTACDLFSTIDFPTDEFFPPKTNAESPCGCK